ncbi:hypothetical protein CERSUDRAFT_119859 [Gelatoporia subvermispora B]|uniref:Uncharacterized protein n=1 Tax=Ceriporiopsis subvermispora (strain B) TaxID=914234 RepID=M2QXP0_CERS8|nr:hypothetical protein CERSUDRAFT_119859 [Gelatoporia subvermispora B]
MSTQAYPEFFRRRTLGRAASPPTWACYEQIPYDDEGSESASDDSCSEDEEDYGHARSSDAEGDRPAESVKHAPRENADGDMDLDEADEAMSTQAIADLKKDVKGKQRATEPEPESPSPRKQPHRRRRQPVFALRPILTIHKSQGFVWNQDLFVPPYIKDRYVASTSPPNAAGFVCSSVSSTNSSLMDYEVEVVEIRVKEGELNDIIP